MRRSALAICIALVWSGVAASADSSIVATLQQADRLAWLTDWYGALPLYEQAEKDSLRAGDRRNALDAKTGPLRGQMQPLPLASLSEQLETELQNPIAKADPRVRL